MRKTSSELKPNYEELEPKYKRVAIVGTHGAWKSTLLSALPLTSKITEKARELIEKYGTTPNNLPYRERVGFENEVLISHIWDEELAIAKNSYFISDRSRYDVLVYANELGLEEEDLKDLEELADGSPKYDKIFYVPIEFPLSEDYARWWGEEFQRKVDLKLRELLLKKGYELTEVRGTVKERVDFILKTLYEG